MSAITPGLNYPELINDDWDCQSDGGLRGLGKKSSCSTPEELLSKAHAQLQFTAWSRAATAEQLNAADRVELFTVARETRIALFKGDEIIKLKFEPTWNPAGRGASFSLLTWTTKMACWSFSLPFGHSFIGGTCPGAAQSVIPYEKWKAAYQRAEKYRAPKLRGMPPGPTGMSSLICEFCYAGKARYGSSNVMASQMARLIWARAALVDGTFVPQMVEALKRVDHRLGAQTKAVKGNDVADRADAVQWLPAEKTGHPYFRIHDSGDFFSIEYLEAWIDVCRKLPEIKFWAPSRSWAQTEKYDEVTLRVEPPPNLIMRPSAFHVNDAGPDDLAGRGLWVMPSTTLTEASKGMMEPENERILAAHLATLPKAKKRDPRPERDPRYDWDCPAYLNGLGAHRCRDAIDIDGRTCCRVCWDSPQLRVNYTLH